MIFVILINAIFGLTVGLLYYPDAPVYLFDDMKFEELWLWSKYAILVSGLLFVFSLLSLDSDNRGRELARSLSAFAATLQGILNLPPIIVYIIFLHGSSSAQIRVDGNVLTISAWVFFLHLALTIVTWSSAAWLALGKKNREFAEFSRLADLQPQP